MHAYLIITRDASLLAKKARELVPDLARIIPFKISAIADTKELSRQTSVAFAEKTVYLLSDFDAANVYAQNAFLKSLEEAGENIVYVLGARSEAAVLPTIVSRCQVIRVNERESKRVKNEKDIKLDFETISKISKREDAVAYLENLIGSLHEALPKSAHTLKYADEALARIKANGNPTLQLTRFVVSI